MKVKICGIKTFDDALAAIDAGADLLGFNFYPPSPRFIPPPECAPLMSRLENHGLDVFGVGVFVNEPAANINRIMDDCGLETAQLSGDEPPEALQALGDWAFKALRAMDQESALQQAGRYARPGRSPALLLDAFRPGLYGGTGQLGDWELARRLAARYPLLLAGGLHPGNVAQAANRVRPWGVDVASGVESTPGCKDIHKMRAFIQAARDFSEEVEQC